MTNFVILFLLLLLLIISFLGASLFITFLLPIFIGAPFLPTSKYKIDTIVKFSNARSGQKIVDLGSGDGRLLIALSKKGAEVHGYEINPLLVWWSRWRIKRVGLSKKAFVHKTNFWNEDLSSYDTIVLFGVGTIMPRLQKKLKKEINKDFKVVSNSFRFSNWNYNKEDDQIFLYKIKNNPVES